MSINGVTIHINQFEPQLGDLRFPININAIKYLIMNVHAHAVDRCIANNDSPHDISLTVNPQAFVRASSQGGADEELLIWLDVRCTWCHRIGDISAA